MQTSFMHRTLIACCLLLFYACNNEKKHDAPATPQETKPVPTGTLPADLKEQPPPLGPNDTGVAPIQISDNVYTSCFVHEGSQYKTTVMMNFNVNDVSGKITSMSLDNNKSQEATFTGTTDGQIIKLDIKGTPPPVGTSAEWLPKKNWEFSKPPLAARVSDVRRTRTLYIFFKAKNSGTGQWEETPFAFKPASCK